MKNRTTLHELAIRLNVVGGQMVRAYQSGCSRIEIAEWQSTIRGVEMELRQRERRT